MKIMNAIPVLVGTAVLVGMAWTVEAGCGSDHSGTSSASDSHMADKEASKMTSKTEVGNIVETATAAGSFNTLLAACKAAGLVETLTGEGPFTVFAPTDEAFAQLPKGTVENLLKPENKAKLQAVLTYHVVPGKVLSSEVVGLDSATTVQGQEVEIDVADGKVMIAGAMVTQADIEASNGVIHVVDKVMLPKL